MRLRHLTLSLAAAGAALLGALPGTASADTARSADAFVDSVGVNTHVIYDDTAYGRFDLVRARLRELGVRHIRDGVCASCHWQHDRLNTLAADGIKANLGVGRPGDDMTANLTAIRTKLKGAVESIEGLNEWDLFSGRSASWVTQTRTWQQDLYRAVKADPELRHLPVIGPSLVFSWLNPSSWTQLGDVSAHLDYGNLHSYPGGKPPEVNLSDEFVRARQISADKPVVSTEAGYHNALQQTNRDHPAVPEDVAATYLPRMFLENFRRGVARTYAYELLDERPGLAAVDMEQSFGLVRADYTPKPAFTALRNLLTVLKDPGTPVGSHTVALDVRSPASDVQRMLLRKRDGQLLVVLWRTGSLWDQTTLTRKTVATAEAEVRFPTELAGAQLYTPRTSATPTALTADRGAVKVQVGADPVVVAVTPTTTPVEAVRAVTAAPSASASTHYTTYQPGLAIDGNASTRWSSQFLENQWWQTDLGQAREIDRVTINWELAFATKYRISTSLDGVHFSPAAEVETRNPGVVTTTFPVKTARFVRVTGIERSNWQRGISFWSFDADGPAPVAAPDPEPVVKPAPVRVATASTHYRADLEPRYASDHLSGTRWSSSFLDNQWWQLDLGEELAVDRVRIHWENAFASRYLISTSTDGVTFTQAADVSIGWAKVEETTFAARTARYVRITGVRRSMPTKGISFWEVDVFGEPVTATATSTSKAAGATDAARSTVGEGAQGAAPAPAAQAARPAAPAAQPAVPAVPGALPATPATPAAGRRPPAAGRTTPAKGRTTPAKGRTTPAAGRTTPAAGRTTPGARGTTPSAKRTKSATSKRRCTTTRAAKGAAKRSATRRCAAPRTRRGGRATDR